MAIVNNPDVPYNGPLEHFTSGRMVRIQGYTEQQAERFNINLQCGPKTDPTVDIALHVSVRLVEGYVARNSYENDGWGNEEGDGSLPIIPGQRFEIIILSDDNDYKIAINGKHFTTFATRIPSSKITNLAINGDVSITLISVESTGAQSPPMDQSRQQSQQFSNTPQGNQYGGPPGYMSPGGQVPGGVYGGYGDQAPPPPSPYQHNQEPETGAFSGIGSLIAGAISSGVAEKLISSMTNHNDQHGGPQQPHPSPAMQIPQLGGQGNFGGLGSVGSLLTGLADQVFHPQHTPQQQPQQQPQHHPQQPAPQGQTNFDLPQIGSLLSGLADQVLRNPNAK